MKKIILFICLVSAFAANAQFSNHTIDVNGETRQYRQYLPSGLTGSEHVPLVIALHGMGDDMQNFSNVGFSYFADTARFICVFPQGEINTFVGASSWNNGTAIASTSDDIGFINRIIDSMYVNYNIDLSRVYVTGFSMGAIMSNRLACLLPYRIAAIAPVSGAMSDVDIANCNPGRPMPVFMLNGTADPLVPYSGTPTFTLSLASATINHWKDNNGATDSTVTALPDIANDTITVDKIVYNGNAPLQVFKENGAEHQWLYWPVNDVDATIEIWLFFRNIVHPSPSMVGVEEDAVEAKLSVFQSGTDLVVKTEKNLQMVEVYDMQGKLLSKANAPKNAVEIRLNIGQQANQIVLVKAMINNAWVTKRIAVVAN